MARKRANADAAAQREWELGIDWARWLLDGNTPQPLQVYGVVLEPGEVAYLQTTAQYSRLYGGNGRYRQSGGFFIGNPTLVVGMMAANAALNAGRKAAAKRDMQPSWRDLQELPVLATNQRLMCNLPEKGWMSFYYSAVQEFYPDTANWTITLGFQNAVPLRIAGLTTPTLAVLTSWCLHGNDRWQGEPGIASLIQAARGLDPANEIQDNYPGELPDQAAGEQPDHAAREHASAGPWVNDPSGDRAAGDRAGDPWVSDSSPDRAAGDGRTNNPSRNRPAGDPWKRDPWER
ncbi:hypothetical protein [Kribbella sp. NPDC004536]|uniref:hypothetical protein n=1 Tax=Kribbella sp. NPDC004536 TaxID=3364106 RepID=UPI0036BDD0B0